MKKSRWNEAATIFKQAQADHGDNLLLLIDLAACEYMLGQVFTWHARLKEIESAVERYREVLSPSTLYNAFLFLGKFLEEQGQFKNALRSYRSVIDGEPFTDRQKIMCLAGVVRVSIFLGLEADAEQGYFDLSTRIRSFEAENQRIEVLHALMWGEMSYIGLDAAVARLQRAAANVEYACDLPLLYFDLLEGLFMRRPEEAISVANVMSRSVYDLASLQPENGFETALSKLSRGEPISYRECFAKADEMSATSQLRLAFLLSRYGQANVDRVRADRLISILLRSFDAFSAKALAKKFGVILDSDNQMEIHLNDRELSVRDEKLNWGRRTTALALLNALVEQPSIEIEVVVKTVWNADFNSSYGERLRILIRRINEDLQAVALKPEVLVVNSGRVSLASGIILKRS